MKDLSPQARAVLDAASGYGAPTAADKARVKALLEARMADPTTPEPDLSGPPESGASNPSLRTNAARRATEWGARAVVASAVVGAGVWLATPATPPDSQSAPPVASETAPAVGRELQGAGSSEPEGASPSEAAKEASPSDIEEAAAVEPAPPARSDVGSDSAAASVRAQPEPRDPSRSAPSPGRRPSVEDHASGEGGKAAARSSANDQNAEASAHSETVSPEHQLAAEAALVRSMQEGLRDEAWAVVLDLADRHREAFASGLLVEERLAAELIAACRGGDERREARARSELLSLFPRSVHLEQAASACER